jgi:hypothetical protein
MIRSWFVPFVIKITMTRRVAEQILSDYTPEERKVLEEAADALVKSIKDGGGSVY